MLMLYKYEFGEGLKIRNFKKLKNNFKKTKNHIFKIRDKLTSVTRILV